MDFERNKNMKTFDEPYDDERQELNRQLVNIIIEKRSLSMGDIVVEEFHANACTTVEGCICEDGTELTFNDERRHFETWDEWIEKGCTSFLCKLLLAMDPDITVPLSLFDKVFDDMD